MRRRQALPTVTAMSLLRFLELPVPAFPAVPAAVAADTFPPSVSGSTPRSMSRLGRMVLAEARPPVQIIFLLRLVAFATAVDGIGRLAGAGMLGLAGWSMIWMAVYVFNGISDVDADRRNGSDRPIASGRLPVGTATQAVVLLALAGLGLCALCSGRLVALGLTGLLIGWRYSAGRVPLKATTGGIALAAAIGVLLCYAAGVVIAGRSAGTATLVFGIAEAAWLGLCAATKDLSDVEGDRLTGRRTWPIVFGDRGARRLVAVASASLAAVFAALAVLSGGGLPVAAGTAAVGGVALSIAVLRCPAAGTRAARRRPYRALMVTQYAVNVSLLISPLA
jgi:4-hydroxybenzoate polyprenyltransferase